MLNSYKGWQFQIKYYGAYNYTFRPTRWDKLQRLLTTRKIVEENDIEPRLWITVQANFPEPDCLTDEQIKKVIDDYELEAFEKGYVKAEVSIDYGL